MAGKPEKHGSGWRVRWTDPRARDRRQIKTGLAGEKEAKLFRAWVENARYHLVTDDDPDVVSDAWLTQVAPTASLDKRQTFGKFARAHIDRRVIQVGTKGDYLRYLEDFFADWLEQPLRDIDRRALEQKVSDFDRRPDIASNSARKYLSLICGILRDAHMMRLVPTNPFLQDHYGNPSRLNWGKAGRGGSRKKLKAEIFLSPETVDYLVEAAPDYQTRMMVRLMLGTGLRISEAFGLRKSDMHFTDKPWIIVQNAILRGDTGSGYGYHEGSPKDWSIREVPLGKKLASEMGKVLAERADDQFVFQSVRYNRNGKRHWGYESFMNNRWRKMIKQAHLLGLDSRINPTPHALRHTYVSRAYDMGMTTFQISKLVGHSSETVTANYYGHLGIGPDREMRKVLARWEDAETVEPLLISLDADAA